MRFRFVKTSKKTKEYFFHECLQFLKWKNKIDFSVTGHAKDKTEGSLPTLQHSDYSSATLDLRQSRDNIEYLLIYKRITVKNEHFSIDKLHDF